MANLMGNKYGTSDTSHFPFDEHECFFEFGSWTFSGEELNVVYEEKEIKGSENSFTLKVVSHPCQKIDIDPSRGVFLYVIFL